MTLRDGAREDGENGAEEDNVSTCITSAYVHMNNAADDSGALNADMDEITEDAAPLDESADRGLSDSDAASSAAVEVAEESIADFQNAELQMKESAGNEPGKNIIAGNESGKNIIAGNEPVKNANVLLTIRSKSSKASLERI